MLTVQEIKKVVTEFFQDKPVKRVYLFGSYARGEADEDSDVDLLVDLDYDKKIGLQYFGWAYYLEQLLKKKVDVASFNEINSRLMKRIEPEIEMMYDATA
jgi:predicted nucleotidyltransferase